MARAAVIPQSSPKRVTRGRAKGTTIKTAGKQTTKITNNLTTTETKRRNARTAPATTSPPSDSEIDEETDDEIGVIDNNNNNNKSRGRTTSSKAKSRTSTTARGRRTATTDKESEIEDDDDDELAQSDSHKKRAGRPKTTAAATPRPRGRPKGTTVKSTTEEDIVKENTRRNARPQDSDSLSSQQGISEIYITTNSVMLREPAKKKKTVTFQEMSNSEDEEEMSETAAPTTRRRKGTVVAKDLAGLSAKLVRKNHAASTRARKPAATKKGSTKPLSPKKATQVAKAISSYASSDGEDDELNVAKDAIKLVVNSPRKRESEITGLGSPVRRINFNPSKISKSVDENGEPTLPPPKAFDFSESLFMSSPARRPPPSPFHFTLRETPKRGGLSLRENAKPLAQPDFSPTQNSPLRTSPRKAKLGTPGRASLFLRDGDGAPGQPSFTPAQDSPLRSSPKKGIFVASFSSQQHARQSSTPFESSLLLSPAKKVSTPFKSSLSRVPSSLARESRSSVDDESDDETVSMDDQSPLRAQNAGNAMRLELGEEESEVLFNGYETVPTEEIGITQGVDGYSSEVDAAQSDHSGGPEEVTLGQEVLPEEDGMSPLKVDVAEDGSLTDQDDDILEEAEGETHQVDREVSLNLGSGNEDIDQEEQEYESTTPPGPHQVSPNQNKYHGSDLGSEQEEPHVEENREPTSSAYRYSLLDGLEDVFTERPPSQELRYKDSAMLDLEEDGENPLFGDEDNPNSDHTNDRGNDEPTLVGEIPTHRPMSPGSIQPYEIEEAENTPFVSFLLTHWVPTLPSVDEFEPAAAPIVDSETVSLQPNASEEDKPDVLRSFDLHKPDSGHNTPSNGKKESRKPSLSNRGPRFTLLAEQLSQWRASSPAKGEPSRPRRRGVFSLAGRPSDISRTTLPPSTNIFSNTLSFSSMSRSEVEFRTEELEIHEDNEDELAIEDKTLDTQNSARQPMAEIVPDETPAPEVFNDEAIRDNQNEAFAEKTSSSALELPEDEKENECIHLPFPATPVKNLALHTQTFHTVSKVPLKPEGQISPLKISRKRGRSLSITSPVRSSPRLRNFVLAPTEHRVPESPPRKSPRLEQGSVRKSQAWETLSKSVEAQQTLRAKTPSRPSSPSKSPRKKVPAYAQCLRGAVVYVDVHTMEGEAASGIFIELLQQMGARCIKNWSWNPRMSLSPEEGVDSKDSKVGITHVVFKDGGVRTLEKVRQAAGLVKCVGVGWVLDCERENKWLDETSYAVDSSIIPRGGAKRRKSMEPRALSNVNGTLIKTDQSGPSTSRRRSEAVRNITPVSRDGRSTPENASKYEPSHTEGDQRYWQTPQTPGPAAYGFNFDAIGMSPATPFYLSQRSKLVQQTCPPKQTRQGLFAKTRSEDEPSQKLKAKLEAARRKSLAFKPARGSPLVE